MPGVAFPCRVEAAHRRTWFLSPALSGLGKTAPGNPGRRSPTRFAVGYYLSPRRGCQKVGVTASRTSTMNQSARQRLPEGLLRRGFAGYAAGLRPKRKGRDTRSRNAESRNQKEGIARGTRACGCCSALPCSAIILTGRWSLRFPGSPGGGEGGSGGAFCEGLWLRSAGCARG
jgi:hypothetical protein